MTRILRTCPLAFVMLLGACQTTTIDSSGFVRVEARAGGSTSLGPVLGD